MAKLILLGCLLTALLTPIMRAQSEAKAFGLDTVKKKMKHEPDLGKALAKESDSSTEPVIFEQRINF